MKSHNKSVRISILIALLMAGPNILYGQNKLEQATAAAVTANENSPQVNLRLIDGSSITGDEAWESEQGIWYRRGGMSHLVARDRVKSIERGPASGIKPDLQVSSLEMADEKSDRQDKPSVSSGADAQRVWIYLIGGARFEVDSVVESAAGVWYRRGSLSVFVERTRIDHLEREALETFAESDSTSKKERAWTTGKPKIDSLIKHNGAKYGVDPYLIFCVMEQESQFNARALSVKGAQGLMQLMPGTSARFGVSRPSDPAQNIAGGTRYLRQLIGQFDGRIDLVLAGYNAGEGAVLRFGRTVPPYRETRDYVKRISYRYGRAKPAVAAKIGLRQQARAGL